MKVLVALALLALFGSLHNPCAAAPAVESTTQTEQDDVKNVEGRLPSEDVVPLPQVKAVIEEALNQQVEDPSEKFEEEQFDALMESFAEYQTFKDIWVMHKRGGSKADKWRLVCKILRMC
ncbi:uncharacterized protein LOC135367130 isoform X2 [Ornithodoros turicata]|uniref:uncharacterized protein LOC135367130 isoform X2 n=1 Tax=Ornithodoros turicata TaxID=34597 RepID=UPI00313A326D